MKNLIVLSVVLILVSAAAAQTVYSAGKIGTIRRIDTSTGATLESIQVGIPMNGLAIDPLTRVAYVVDTVFPRNLYRVNLGTGASVLIGSTGVQISGLAVDAAGTLLGIEGDGGLNPGRLHSLNKATGAATPIMSYGNPGLDGEEIAVSPLDGLIYRFDRTTLTSIDPAAGFGQTFIGSGLAPCQVNSMGFMANGDILAGTICGDFFSMTTAGVVTMLPALDHLSGDLALCPDPIRLGTFEDLVTEYAVNGDPYAVLSACNEEIALNVGDTIAVRHGSPGGTFDFLEFAAFGTIAPIGTPSTSPFPGLHLLVGGGIYSPVSGTVAGTPFILPPGGVAYAGSHIGVPLSGVTTLIQAVSITGTAANSIFASTIGLSIDFL